MVVINLFIRSAIRKLLSDKLPYNTIFSEVSWIRKYKCVSSVFGTQVSMSYFPGTHT